MLLTFSGKVVGEKTNPRTNNVYYTKERVFTMKVNNDTRLLFYYILQWHVNHREQWHFYSIHYLYTLCLCWSTLASDNSWSQVLQFPVACPTDSVRSYVRQFPVACPTVSGRMSDSLRPHVRQFPIACPTVSGRMSTSFWRRFTEYPATYPIKLPHRKVGHCIILHSGSTTKRFYLICCVVTMPM